MSPKDKPRRKKKKLVIDRARWARGSVWSKERLSKGQDDVNILYGADDRRMCCLGFYLRSCGMSVAEIKEQSTPLCVAQRIPEEARWLVNEAALRYGFGRNNSDETIELMRLNDGKRTERVREEKIAKAFAKHNVEVIFRGRTK